MSNNQYINRKHCKDFALKFAQENRTGWMPERVSRQFLDDLDIKVRQLMASAIAHHPSVGKTIKHLF